MRLFVGIELTGPALDHVLAVRERLVESITRQGVRFVRPDKLHLTVTFLGQVEDSALEPLKAALDGLGESACFKLEATGLGGFPDLRRPKVLWVGVDGDLKAMEELAIAAAVGSQPFAPEMDAKSFSPHITLARISPGSKEVGRKAYGLNIDGTAAELLVTWVALFHSKPDGTYEVLHRVALRGAD